MIDFDGVEDEHVDSGLETFNKAANHLQTLVDKLDPTILLTFYGLYKQSTTGRCNTAKPGIFNMQGRAKWNAWNDLGDMPQEQAMLIYVEKLLEIDPDWKVEDDGKTKKPCWVSVSTPFHEEELPVDGNRTLIDFVKDGKLDGLQSAFDATAFDINERDDEGLSAIHWAADRGNAAILEWLLMHGADVNGLDADGSQTALHYAVSCGHFDCVKLLIKHGADRTIRDNEEATCIDLATDSNDVPILELLKS